MTVSGRLRSYVRPLHAAWIAAGPDGLRGSGPEQGSDVYASLGSTGCPGPRTERSPSCCGPCKRQRAVVTGSSRLRSAVQFAAHQHGPDGAGHLVGQRDRRELSRLARQQLQKPGRVVAARLFGFAASLDLLDDGSGAEHQQPAQAFIAFPADLAELLPPCRRVLAWCDPEPGSKMPTGTEDGGIGHLEGDVDRRDRPDAGDRRQQLAARIGFVMRHQLGLECRQPHFDGGQLAGQVVQQFARRLRHIGLAGNPLEQLLDLLRPLRADHAELRRVPADRIAQHRALLGQQIAHLQEHQRRLLFTTLDRHEAHPRPAHRLADRFGVDHVVLAAFNVGLDVLRWDQHDLVPQIAQHPSPMVRGAARFQPDPRRRQLGEKLLNLTASQLPAQHRPLLLVRAVHLKDALGCIQPDPDNRHRTASLGCGYDNPQSGTLDAVGGRPPQQARQPMTSRALNPRSRGGNDKCDRLGRAKPVTALAAAVVALKATPAAAHGFGQRYDLPLPLSLYLFGAAGAVVVSFIIVGLFVRGGASRTGFDRRFDLMPYGIGRLILHPAFGLVLKLIAFVIFAVTVMAGFIGNQDPYRNLAPTMVWIVFWVGLAYVSAFTGNIWALVNPWGTIFAAAERLWKRVANRPRLQYPEALGVWPACLLLLVFSWIELVYPSSAVPRQIAWLAAAYSVLTWTGMTLFGAETWLQRAEVFTLVFGTFDRFAPTEISRCERVCALR